uniref:Sugar phosphate transporter domain-containing protein n=1 Tax=Chrysotila carterae TaxID=13221 RepID=A0A7S4C5K1_CHRCT
MLRVASAQKVSAPALPTVNEEKASSTETLPLLPRAVDEKASATPNQAGSGLASKPQRERPGPVSLTGDSSSWAPGKSGVIGPTLSAFSPATLAMIFFWYVSGALTNSTSKQALQQFKSPPFMSLTLMQHLTATLCGNILLRLLGLRRYKSLPPEAFSWGFLRMILVYSFGFCLTNGSFGAVNASFVDTVKAGEPIATMILTVLFLDSESVTLPVCLSLLPIVGGVSVSSMAEASFNLKGFAMAMGSNLCFSARSICAKLLRSELGRNMDNANLFLHVNAYGSMLLLPFVLYIEGPALITILSKFDRPAKLFIFNGFLYFFNNQLNFLVLEKVLAAMIRHELSHMLHPLYSRCLIHRLSSLMRVTCPLVAGCLTH